MVTCYKLEQGKCFLGYTDKRLFCKCQSGIENVGVTRVGGIPQQSFILGIKLRLEVQLLTFLYIFFYEKRHPSLKHYLPLTNGTPFKYLV